MAALILSSKAAGDRPGDHSPSTMSFSPGSIVTSRQRTVRIPEGFGFPASIERNAESSEVLLPYRFFWMAASVRSCVWSALMAMSWMTWRSPYRAARSTIWGRSINPSVP